MVWRIKQWRINCIHCMCVVNMSVLDILRNRPVLVGHCQGLHGPLAEGCGQEGVCNAGL